MTTTRTTALLAVFTSLLPAMGCDSSDDCAAGQETAGAAAIMRDGPSAAKPEDPQAEWSGIQSCSGSEDYDELDSTTAETTIASFERTRTGVTIKGVNVGPSAEYSCKDMVFDGIVTDSAGDTLFFFESASSKAEKQKTCTSSTGRSLVIGWLDGSDTDLRSIGSDWSVKFELRIEEPVDPDAGSSSRLDIRCSFDLRQG